MLQVQYPRPEFRIREEGATSYIFCDLRRAWLVLTEEEWVRQNFIRFLTRTMNYPAAMIAVEKEIRLQELKKRFDILVYDRNFSPWMLVECKEESVALTESVLAQVLRYHIAMPASYLVITNGRQTMAWGKRSGGLDLLESFPAWPAAD